MPLLVLSAADVTELLDWSTVIGSQRRAFSELAAGNAFLAEKVAVPGRGADLALNYTARIAPDAAAVAKFLAVVPGNTERGLPIINGVIVVLDADTGLPAALVDGNSVTELRTAAGSAVAVDALAPAGARHLVVVGGAGLQGRAHVRAVSHVRDLEQVTLVVRDQAKGDAAAAELASELGLAVTSTSDAEAAVRSGDVVVTCTTSYEPVVEHAWFAPGATVLSVGSFNHDRREVPRVTLERAAAVVVDDVDTSVAHAGTVIDALESGVLSADDLVTLGDVLNGRHPGRRSDDELVFYNSVGVGVQDAAAAEALLDRAREAGRGQSVTL